MYHRLVSFLTASSRYHSLIKCLSIYFLLTFLSALLMMVLDSLTPPLFGVQAISKTRWKVDEILSHYGLFRGTILITLLGPLVEETAFRLGLIPNRVAISISTGVLLFFLSGPVFFVDDLGKYSIRVFTSTVISIVSYAYSPSNLTYFFNKYYNSMIYLSSILFAALHIGNFNVVHKEVFFLYPFYVLPQFFMGLISSWLRIQQGFIWSVVFHILINGSVTWPKFFLTV